MSKLDAAVYEMLAESLERIQEAISAPYKNAEEGSESEQVFSAFDDAFTTEIDTLRNLADAVPAEDRD